MAEPENTLLMPHTITYILDKNIINECSNFVDRIDPEKKYLTSRRYITKAKFDTYFSIRTPVEQYAERQNILKNYIQKKKNVFKKINK